ncbi:MAG: hypothetical protein JXR68_14220 [Bacteroidales bacterium]|nr:hypothetical protein [Bacteroidales bacterium]
MEINFLDILNNYGLPLTIAAGALFALYKVVKVAVKYIDTMMKKFDTLQEKYHSHLEQDGSNYLGIIQKNNEVFDKIADILQNIERVLK